MEEMSAYVLGPKDPDKKPLVLVGTPGEGKSSLMANFAKTIANNSSCMYFIYFYFFIFFVIIFLNFITYKIFKIIYITHEIISP